MPPCSTAASECWPLTNGSSAVHCPANEWPTRCWPHIGRSTYGQPSVGHPLAEYDFGVKKHRQWICVWSTEASGTFNFAVREPGQRPRSGRACASKALRPLIRFTGGESECPRGLDRSQHRVVQLVASRQDRPHTCKRCSGIKLGQRMAN